MFIYNERFLISSGMGYLKPCLFSRRICIHSVPSVHNPSGHIANDHMASGSIPSVHSPSGHVANDHMPNGSIPRVHNPSGHIANGHIPSGTNS